MLYFRTYRFWQISLTSGPPVVKFTLLIDPLQGHQPPMAHLLQGGLASRISPLAELP